MGNIVLLPVRRANLFFQFLAFHLHRADFDSPFAVGDKDFAVQLFEQRPPPTAWLHQV